MVGCFCISIIIMKVVGFDRDEEVEAHGVCLLVFRLLGLITVILSHII